MDFISSYVYDSEVNIEYIKTSDSNTLDIFTSSVNDFKEWLRDNMPTYYDRCMVVHRGTATRFFDIERLDSSSEAFAYYLMDNV